MEEGTIRRTLVATLTVVAVGSCVVACKGDVGASCNSTSDCRSPLQCIGSVCTDTTDGGADAGDVAMDVPGDTTDVVDTVDIVRDVPMPPHDAGDCGSAPVGTTTCNNDMVRTLALGGTVCGTLVAPGHIDSSGCQPDTRGPEQVLSFHLATAGGVTLSVQSGLDLVLSLRTGCPPTGQEIGCNEQQGSALAPALRASLPAGDYQVIVDQFGASGLGGDFALASGMYTPAANASCTAAPMLTPGVDVMGTIALGDSTSRACRTADSGSELFYRVQIPAGQHATIVATPTGRAWRPFLHAFDQCMPSPNCLADAAATSVGSMATLTIPNPGTAPFSAFVVVAAETEPVDPGATFTLSSSVGP